jgi:hypothetical protein
MLAYSTATSLAGYLTHTFPFFRFHFFEMPVLKRQQSLLIRSHMGLIVVALDFFRATWFVERTSTLDAWFKE